MATPLHLYDPGYSYGIGLRHFKVFITFSFVLKDSDNLTMRFSCLVWLLLTEVFLLSLLFVFALFLLQNSLFLQICLLVLLPPSCSIRLATATLPFVAFVLSVFPLLFLENSLFFQIRLISQWLQYA